MKKTAILSALLCLMVFGLAAQVVEVEGKIKVTDMDTLNNESMLVVKQPDGTLATRMASSLPPAPDTVRSLQSDLLLTSALCNCPSLPPAMIQSLLDNGYTVQDLIGFQVPVQAMLDAGQTPIDLFNGGAGLESLYGNTYEGGFIFYLDTITGTGFVAAPPLWDGTNDPDPTPQWGCWGDFIGATSEAIGTGAQNTMDIISGCATSGIAADICSNLDLNGFDDWVLPSRDEISEMYLNIGQAATGANENIGGFADAFYWTSSEISPTTTWSRSFGFGAQGNSEKTFTLRVRPVRAF